MINTYIYRDPRLIEVSLSSFTGSSAAFYLAYYAQPWLSKRGSAVSNQRLRCRAVRLLLPVCLLVDMQVKEEQIASCGLEADKTTRRRRRPAGRPSMRDPGACCRCVPWSEVQGRLGVRVH